LHPGIATQIIKKHVQIIALMQGERRREGVADPMNLRILPSSSLMGAMVRRFQNVVPSFL
jgi:hypothetical protein